MSSGDFRHFDPATHGPELSAYVDNELSGAERAEIERLLAESAEARAAVAELREIADALRSLPHEPSPIDFAASVRREGLPAAASGADSASERTWRIPLGLRTLASAAAIAICVGTAWRIMLPPTRPATDLTTAERIGRPNAPEMESPALRKLEADRMMEWAPPPAAAPPPADAMRGGGGPSVNLALRPESPAAGHDAAGGAVSGLSGMATMGESSAGASTGEPTGYVSFDDAGNRITRFGRVYIPTQNVEQYNNVLFAISAIQRSAGEAPSYVASKPVPTQEEVQLRVPVARAPEVLTTLNNMVVPEQVRVELNVVNDESSYRQLQMLLSQATSRPSAHYAFEVSPDSQPTVALGAPLEPAGDGMPGAASMEPRRDEPAEPAAKAVTESRETLADARSKKAEESEEAKPAAPRSATGKDTDAETADRVAAAELKGEGARKPAARDGRVGREAGVRGGGGGGEPRGGIGAGRGFAGGEAAQTAPARADDKMAADADAPRGERVTALITRGQAVWSQLSNSAATIVNRFGEITQSNRRQMNAVNDLLMFDVTVLPPPQQTTQPAAGREHEAGEKPPSDKPR